MEGAHGYVLSRPRVRRTGRWHVPDLAHLRRDGQPGKTTAHTDTYRGRFVRLVPDELVVEADEFETEDPAFRGEMTITITLADAGDGTDLVAVHEGFPVASRPRTTKPAGGGARQARRARRG